MTYIKSNQTQASVLPVQLMNKIFFWCLNLPQPPENNLKNINHKQN